MIVCGIDAGSRTIKAVLWDSRRSKVVASGLCAQGVRQAELAEKLLRKIQRQSGSKAGDVEQTVATGYGRNNVKQATLCVTEITCHARGVRHVFPGARTAIDIGGEDSKVIRMDRDGMVQDFAMNNRCAAGTGRFLELVAKRLDIDLAALGMPAGKARKPATISSMCAVFAETEIVGLLASGEKSANIVAGVQEAIAARILAMSGRELDTPVVFTGGVALIPGMREALERAFGQPIRMARDPQFTGALGAALIALEMKAGCR